MHCVTDVIATWTGGLTAAAHEDCPDFRGGDDVALKKEPCRREDGSIPLGRKGTGTFFGRQALTQRDSEAGRKMSQSPAACKGTGTFFRRQALTQRDSEAGRKMSQSPAACKGTGTFFRRQALTQRDSEAGRKMSQSPAACVPLATVETHTAGLPPARCEAHTEKWPDLRESPRKGEAADREDRSRPLHPMHCVIGRVADLPSRRGPAVEGKGTDACASPREAAEHCAILESSARSAAAAQRMRRRHRRVVRRNIAVHALR